jgi:hypothetical protein
MTYPTPFYVVADLKTENLITTQKFEKFSDKFWTSSGKFRPNSANIKCLPPVRCRDAGGCGGDHKSVWKQKPREVARGT